MSELDKENELHLKGYFWFPDEVDGDYNKYPLELPDNSYAGELTYKPRKDRKISIELTADVSPPNVQKGIFEYGIIHGFSVTGKKITVCNASFAGITYRPGLSATRISALELFIGHFFTSLDDITFKEIRYSYSNLYDWVGKSGFHRPDVNYKSSKSITLSYTNPTPINSSINNNFNIQIAFAPTYSGGFNINKASITQNTYVHFQSKRTEKSFKQYEEMSQQFRHLVSVGTLQSTSVIRATGLTKKAQWRTPENTQWVDIPVEIYCLAHNTKDIPDKKDFRHYLFQYVDIDNIDILQQWFSMYKKYQPAYDLYIYTDYYTDIPLDTKLISYVSAFEAYYSRTDYKQENTIREKIQTFYSCHTAIFDQYFKRPDTTFKRIIDMRNYLIHYNPTREYDWKKEGQYLFVFCNAMKLIMNISILLEFGLSDDKINTLIKNFWLVLEVEYQTKNWDL